jgi:hypothetical protein
VAHHAGGSRIEALQVLEALDQLLGVLETIEGYAPRRYHFVVLSDHGQSQGPPFEARYGQTLAGLCSELTSEEVVSLEENVEAWGRAESVLDDLASDQAMGSHAAARAASHLQSRTAPDEGAPTEGDLVVLGSGNLGLVYAREPQRLSMEEIEQRWPRLLPGLVASAGIGFVAVMSREHGPVVLGAAGSRTLRDDVVSGVDPLAAFAPHAAWALLRAAEMPSAPDVYVNSAVNVSSLEVSAFEDLVGAHGGLGGWQDRGLFIAPSHLVDDGPDIRGAEELHGVLVSVLERLGHRAGLRTGDAVAHG